MQTSICGLQSDDELTISRKFYPERESIDERYRISVFLFNSNFLRGYETIYVNVNRRVYDLQKFRTFAPTREAKVDK